MGVAKQMGFFESNKKSILISLTLLLLLGAFVGGFYIARAGYSFDVKAFSFVHQNQENAPQDVNWQILWDAMEVINEKYVDGPIDQQELLYGAVSGLVASLGDPYSVFLTPQKSEQFQEDLRGEFSGIGAEIGIRNNQLLVVAPLEGSPAEAAGLRAKDAILAIDGESAADFSLDEAVNKIRGPQGSSVEITVIGENDNEPHTVSITRDTIIVKSLESEIREIEGNKIGIITLRRFGEDTQGLLDSAVTDLLQQNVSGIVLDMRNNPGGYITSAIDIASFWVQDGQAVVIEEFGDGKINTYDASGAARLNEIPTVVVVNEGSASASEIVAGALRDYGLAKLVGKQTFGKGSVQELINLPEGADIKITIAKWLTPNGHNINVDGLPPDIEVELTEDDVNNFLDPQLDKAIEELVKDF